MFTIAKYLKHWNMLGSMLVVLVVVASIPSVASALIYDFWSELSGPLASQSVTGWFEIDDAAIDFTTISTSGMVNHNNGGLLGLELTFNGNVYTPLSDAGYPDWPQFALLDGQISLFDYATDAFSVWIRGDENKFGYYGEDQTEYTSTVSYAVREVGPSAVPEPSTAILVGIGLLAVGYKLKRNKGL
jgi:hypothetical protein